MMAMKTLKYMVLAMAVVAAMATGAYADVFLIQSGGDLPQTDAGEETFVEAAVAVFLGVPSVDLELLFKTGDDGDGSTGTCPGGPDCITSTAGGGQSATVSWAGLSTSLNYILIVDGGEGVGNDCEGTTGGDGGKCYALWG